MMKYACPLGLLVASLLAADWPQFRGPNASGIGVGRNLPVEVGASKNLIWKVTIPPGKSSPVLAGDAVFLTAFEGGKLLTLCLHAKTGKLRWRQELIPDRSEFRTSLNDPASPSPVVDGKDVYVFFPEIGLVSYTVDGRERWRLPLGPFQSIHGMAASPIVHEDTVFLVCDHEGPSFLLAVDKESGKVKWRVARPDVFSGFATPVIFRPKDGPDQVLVLGSRQLTSYSASRGERLWWLRGFSIQSKAVPVTADGVIYSAMRGTESEGPGNFPLFSTALKQQDKNQDGKLAPAETEGFVQKGFAQIDLNQDGLIDEPEYDRFRSLWITETQVAAVRPEGAGDLTENAVLWKYHKGVAHVSSPLFYKGVLYLLREGGILTALEANSGKPGKVARITGAPGDYYASPVAAEDKIYTLSTEGKLAVIKTGLLWEVLAVNDLREECFATPAIGKTGIYVRTSGTLLHFGN